MKAERFRVLAQVCLAKSMHPLEPGASKPGTAPSLPQAVSADVSVEPCWNVQV